MPFFAEKYFNVVKMSVLICKATVNSWELRPLVNVLSILGVHREMSHIVQQFRTTTQS